ncbi:hypothetical protein GCM10011514_21590 [Emticicia aquatilis]|uniref:DUF3347 domain-containing protein n=1 Tax=Emticicia aquatilis TaxID=1537369 RepID=A0A916YRH4_9BACT|nr:DUF3347 domain-containing protein [Emticicia aquatilis]GGD57214.1 hypothetical protein GCM10011514_21590 [Emticicia aquatilis]
MKTIKHTIILIAFFASNTFAQNGKFDKIDAITANQVNTLINSYYAIKDALVATDGSKASIEAKNFLAKLDVIDQSKMTTEQKFFFKPLNERMSSDAKHISENKDPEHQREHFRELSTNMVSLIKAFGNTEDSFVQYCPMVKKSWLSNNKAIKNPYYGNKMLNCGKVTEIISKK